MIEFITSAAREASAENYHLVVWPVSNDGVELSELVGQGLVDGVLLMEVQLDDPRVARLQALDIPFALIGRTATRTGSTTSTSTSTRRSSSPSTISGSSATAGSRWCPAVRTRRAFALRPVRPLGDRLPRAVCTARDRAVGPALPADGAFGARRRYGARGHRAGHHRRDHCRTRRRPPAWWPSWPVSVERCPATSR